MQDKKRKTSFVSAEARDCRPLLVGDPPVPALTGAPPPSDSVPDLHARSFPHRALNPGRQKTQKSYFYGKLRSDCKGPISGLHLNKSIKAYPSVEKKKKKVESFSSQTSVLFFFVFPPPRLLLLCSHSAVKTNVQPFGASVRRRRVECREEVIRSPLMMS